LCYTIYVLYYIPNVSVCVFTCTPMLTHNVCEPQGGDVEQELYLFRCCLLALYLLGPLCWYWGARGLGITTRTHTHPHTHTHIHTHTHTHTYTHTRIHTHTHTNTRAQTHTRARARAYTHMQTYILLGRHKNTRECLGLRGGGRI